MVNISWACICWTANDKSWYQVMVVVCVYPGYTCEWVDFESRSAWDQCCVPEGWILELSPVPLVPSEGYLWDRFWYFLHPRNLCFLQVHETFLYFVDFSAIFIRAFLTGYLACNAGTVDAGGDVNILTMSSAAWTSWSFRVTLGNATLWGQNVTVSQTRVVLVRGKYAVMHQ